MSLTWREGADIELADGYTVTDADARQVGLIRQSRVAIEGGFVHINAAGTDMVQVVSAPAVRRITYHTQEEPRG
jgi:hypothetical protein